MEEKFRNIKIVNSLDDNLPTIHVISLPLCGGSGYKLLLQWACL